MRIFHSLPILLLLAAPLNGQSSAGSTTPVVSSSTKSLEKADAIRTSLLKGEIEQAQKSVDEALATDPNNPDLLAVAGDVSYRKAEMSKALQEYQAALKVNPNSARGLFGLARMHERNSNHLSARNLIRRAHELAPADQQITRFWMSFLPVVDRLSVSANATYAKEDEKDHKAQVGSITTLLKLLDGGKLQELTVAPGKRVLALQPLMWDANHQRAVGLRVSINGSKPFLLMLDTGASGILVKSNVAERATMKKIGERKIGGIGDKGLADGYSAFAEAVSVEGVEFKNVIVDVVERKDATDDDGVIGADVFDQFLITLDFANLKLQLDPLPNAARSYEDATLTDRTIPSGMELACKTYRVGHELYIQAKVDGIGPTFFLIDTGSSANMLAEAIAKQVKGYSQDAYSKVKGLNGSVSHVYRIDEVDVTTERFRQKTRGMIVLDIHTLSQNAGFEAGGIIGYELLRNFVIKIDYRDGLIDFKYVGKPRDLFAPLNGKS
jgi:tetratricopeptide (TPR) repeat protein